MKPSRPAATESQEQTVSETNAKTAREPRCPLCGKPRVPSYRPFCSARCRDLDLNKWLNDGYAIPAADPEEEPMETAPPAVRRGRSF